MFRSTPNRLPLAPREITDDMRQDTALVGRMFRIFGTVWSAIGLAVMLVTAGAAFGAHAPQALVGTAIGGAISAVALSLLLVGGVGRPKPIGEAT